MKRGRKPEIAVRRKSTRGKPLSFAIRTLAAGKLAERKEYDAIARLHDVLTADPKDENQRFPAEFIEQCKADATEILFQAVKGNDSELFLRVGAWLHTRATKKTEDQAALLVRVFAEEMIAMGKHPTGEKIAERIDEAIPEMSGKIDPRQIYRLLGELGFKRKKSRFPDKK